ncbi:hypothetical protein Pfo_013629 [Paulownia fortunei]|nr:hypothetical protein Pfo_013629 [Paulownia fortunei]
MAQEREPLWLFDVDKGSEVLNVAEYKQRFASLDPTLEVIIRVITEGEPSDLPNLNKNVESRPDNGCMSSYTTENMASEASRAIGVFSRNPISLVNMFMDVDKWSAMFSNIVSKAINLAVLSAGNQENPNGALQVARELYFVRYSRQIDIDTWVVADVYLETVFPNPVVTCQIKPSGCIIQALQDGLSTVTWVEHNAECNDVVHSCMFRGLLTSGLAFSTKRWVSSLERQCDRIASLEAQNDCLSTNNKGLGAARNGLLKLADRMFRQFNFNICSKMESARTPLPVPGAEEILIKTSFNLDEPQIPRGVAVTIATSVWLPVKQNDVFNFLPTEHNRNKPSSTRRTAITYLQESFSDSTAYYIVYAPVDVPAMHHILQVEVQIQWQYYLQGLQFYPMIMDEQLTPPQELPPQSVLTAHRLIKETGSWIRTALLPKI